MSAALPVCKPEDVGLSSAALGRLSAALRERIASGHLPGAVALVARHGKIAYFEALGVQDPTSRAPMTKEAIFRIYSMTKPLVSVGVMMLWEEGRLLLSDPIEKYLPAFASPNVGVISGESMTTTPANRSITVQDLLRHTSGLTYEFRGNTPVHKAYIDSKVSRLKQTNEDQVATLGSLPLLHQPGTKWEYSRSTDVLGRLIEVISGQTLGVFLNERICGPLGMADAGFTVPERDRGRIAEPFAKDPENKTDISLLDVRRTAIFESGGGGMVATAMDYARFCAMLLNNGRLDSTRLLGRKTLELMTSDHLGAIAGNPELLPPGHGFGLGFAVRTAAGMAPFPGTVGNYYWSGAAGTSFWVDPAERLFGVLMIQAPVQREHYRLLFRDLVYAAIAD
ncbi:MAG: class A beta-lactamase-related serine hydrolase [Acetobacteraceae bacterium]|nr:class A beta-lactamase-related serine hydrolase [Acetobacteraceae bacterium]